MWNPIGIDTKFYTTKEEAIKAFETLVAEEQKKDPKTNFTVNRNEWFAVWRPVASPNHYSILLMEIPNRAIATLAAKSHMAVAPAVKKRACRTKMRIIVVE